jgi:hypothetical protein
VIQIRLLNTLAPPRIGFPLTPRGWTLRDTTSDRLRVIAVLAHRVPQIHGAGAYPALSRRSCDNRNMGYRTGLATGRCVFCIERSISTGRSSACWCRETEPVGHRPVRHPRPRTRAALHSSTTRSIRARGASKPACGRCGASRSPLRSESSLPDTHSSGPAPRPLRTRAIFTELARVIGQHGDNIEARVAAVNATDPASVIYRFPCEDQAHGPAW